MDGGSVDGGSVDGGCVWRVLWEAVCGGKCEGKEHGQMIIESVTRESRIQKTLRRLLNFIHLPLNHQAPILTTRVFPQKPRSRTVLYCTHRHHKFGMLTAAKTQNRNWACGRYSVSPFPFPE